MLHVVKAPVTCLLLLWVAGCAYDVSHPVAPGRLTATQRVAEPLIVAPPAPLPDVSPAIDLAPGLQASSDAEHRWPQEWVNVWLPIETWSKFNQLERPVQYGSGGDASFLVQTTNGTFRLKVGSHTLEYAGQGFLLGFAPRLIKGFLYVHAIDACKTLQPLLGKPWQLTKTNRTIVIDPGHGGKDSGTQSCFDREYEKTYALDWAVRLAMLLRECGWNVVLTRTNDSYLSLADRIAIADRAKADVFVSLHFNSGNDNSGLAGLETYCLTPAGMPSSLLRGEDDPRDVHPNNAYDEENFQLATALHRAALKMTGTADRGVGRARFMGVLRGQTRPAVLVEGGYLTNPHEAQKIGTPEYRQALAEGLAKALQ